MKRKIILIITFTFILLLALLLIFNKSNNNKKKEKITNKTNKTKEKSVEQIVDEKMKSMTINQKISQMLILYYTSDTVSDDLINTLKTNTPGGFILMSENITTYDKTKNFVSTLNDNSNIPLIISIDEEGGNVQRLRNLSDITPTNIPYMYDLGKTNDDILAYETGKVIAEEVKAIGVNVVFAPVVDIYSNKNNTVIGKRSFGENPFVVSKMANKLANALEDNDVIASYKHFPGHGDTSVDSHIDLPIINKSYDELKNLELITFDNAIKNDAKIIMVGHIALPNITNDNTPASLSKKIITDILKKDMNYNGLVITDALNMGALKNNYTDEEIYTSAINAGVDLLLMPNGSKKAIEYIKNNISEERIDESVKKILTFKYKYLNKTNNYFNKDDLGSISHKKIIDKIPN